jgi:Tol biopolymer transport system component
MTDQPRFERGLTGLLEDLYLGPLPSYRDDVLAIARRTRQRPAWSFPERWLPVDITMRPAFAGGLPMRAISLALLVLALVAAGLLWYIGATQHRLPAPFGPARNGGVVYALDGDLYLGDPATGESRPLVVGDDYDLSPFVSPTGDHVAFLRGETGSTADAFDLMVATVDGSRVTRLSRVKVSHGDWATWSPDGTYLLLTNAQGQAVRYNADGTGATLLAADTLVHEFRPPNGEQVLFESLAGERALGIMNADGSNRRVIYGISAVEQQDGCDFGTVSWSPDGSRIAFLRHPIGTEYQCRVFVMNADGTDAHQVSTEPGLVFETDLRWSPDGTQLAFDRWRFETGDWLIQPIAIAPADGGAPRSVGPTPVADGAAFEWSPDGTSIYSIPGTVLSWPPSTTLPDAKATIIDVATGEWTEAPWSANSSPAWQRLAP